METIKNYLDNMFTTLPKTKEIEKLRNDMLSNMEDKYNQLKNEGKSENEAIGIVISEFGNIDEIMREFEIDCNSEVEMLPSLKEDEVIDYLETSKKAGKIIGIGVFLCILAPATLILLNQLLEDGFFGGISKSVGEILMMIPLLLLVATAVGLFIYSGMISDKFKYLENDFKLSNHIKSYIIERNNSFNPIFTLSIIVGVGLCILSPIVILVTSAFSESASTYGVTGLLIIIAVAVYIFVYFGSVKNSYKKLLKLDEYSYTAKDKKKKDKVIGAIAAIVWPTAVCIFLISGFVYNKWGINWIIFPITGLLFGAFSGFYSILKKGD
ncbi:MAG: permease prefix domain 1-containing protein [Clostridiaceae bacterium]